MRECYEQDGQPVGASQRMKDKLATNQQYKCLVDKTNAQMRAITIVFFPRPQ